MNLLNLLAKIQDVLEQAYPNITKGFILVLLTILISATVGTLLASVLLLKNRKISESFYLFVYSFLGCLSGGVLGSFIGSFVGIIFTAFSPAGDGLFGGFAGMGVATVWENTVAMCWFTGISIGALITAQPLIESFNNK